MFGLVTFLVVAAAATPAESKSTAAKQIKKASKPQQLIVQLGLTVPCEEKHTAVAVSRLMLTTQGKNVTFETSCLNQMEIILKKLIKEPTAQVTLTFVDQSTRSASYRCAHQRRLRVTPLAPSTPHSKLSRALAPAAACLELNVAVGLCVASACGLQGAAHADLPGQRFEGQSATARERHSARTSLPPVRGSRAAN
jgi:hypothetical protein